MKNWKEYEISDIGSLINTLPLEEQEDYEIKTLYENKKLFGKNEESKIKIFSKQGFRDYSSNYDAYVVGRIKKQKKYKFYYNKENYFNCSSDEEQKLQEEHIAKKKKEHIRGIAWFDCPECVEGISEDTLKKATDNKNNNKYQKFYDIKETKGSNVYGYAYIGNNQFLEVSRFGFIPLFISLLALLLTIILVLSILMNNKVIPNPFKTAEETQIEKGDNQPVAAENLPNCDYLLFGETVTLTKDNPYIKLCNLSSNEGLWYISYQLYIDGEPLMDINDPTKEYNTGAIKPGFQVDGTKDDNLNLYNRLEAGSYKLTAKATQYKFEPNENDEHLKTLVSQNIETTLIIEK